MHCVGLYFTAPKFYCSMNLLLLWTRWPRSESESELSLAKKYKQTFFINSHNLSEVQRICDRIAIIDKGQILLTGTTAELREQLHAKQEYVIRVTGDIEKAKSIAESHHFVESIKAGVDSLVVTIDNPLENNSQLMQGLLAAGVNIIEFAEEEASLEDLYLEVLNGGSN